MESPNTSPQEIELNPSCSAQAQSNILGTGPGYENTEPECSFAVLCNSSIEKRGCLVLQSCLINFAQLAQTSV